MLLTALFCLFAYGIGSISSAVLICRLLKLPDPRKTGSHNPGTTNVLRLGGKKAAVLTLLGDVIKGVIPVWVATQASLTDVEIGVVMIAVVVGHLYPIFFKFQGGKGVATTLGAALAFCWPVGLLLLATWGIIVYMFRVSSFGALIAAFTAPFYTYMWCGLPLAIAMAVVSIFLFWRHRENIKRLIQGIEPKLGSSKSSKR